MELSPGGQPCPEVASWVALGGWKCPSHSPTYPSGLMDKSWGPFVIPRPTFPTLSWMKMGLRQGGAVVQSRLVPSAPSRGGGQPPEGEEESRLCSAP